MTPDTSGRLFTLPLLTWDPDSSSWRTSGAISRSGSTKSSVTLPASGMTRSGELFEHPTWAAATSVHASSLLPTPTASQPGGTVQRHLERKGPGRNTVTDLGMVVEQLLPTPPAQNGEPRNQTPYLRPLTDPQNLENAVARMLPTPTARDWKGHNQRHDATCLPGALLPTPRTSDANGTGEHGTGRPDLRTAVSALTPPPSDAKKPGTGPHPTPPPTGDSTPPSSSG